MNITHGWSHTPQASAWYSMLSRCYKSSTKEFEHYGGRGITVCDRWRNSLINFIEDMGPRPPKTTLGRIDNNENYVPENCRWETYKEQLRNTSRTRWITFNGEKHSLAEWSELRGINYYTLNNRIRRGWLIKDALNF